MKRKTEREERKKAIIDMNSFLLTYAMNVLPDGTKDIAGTVYNAAKNNLNDLDALFNDGGIGRTLKYMDIAEGCVRNLYDLAPEDAEKEAQSVGVEAVSYLGSNIEAFNHWLSE
ncbi:hypothetical protein [Nicoliella lavandulae]|uniref:Four helix bundle protein n=1 Tax=Nicoliella lavandulae TaxID=3082954 RepID=A0ABU8SIJ2_9LACO